MFAKWAAIVFIFSKISNIKGIEASQFTIPNTSFKESYIFTVFFSYKRLTRLTRSVGTANKIAKLRTILLTATLVRQILGESVAFEAIENALLRGFLVSRKQIRFAITKRINFLIKRSDLIIKFSIVFLRDAFCSTIFCRTIYCNRFRRKLVPINAQPKFTWAWPIAYMCTVSRHVIQMSWRVRSASIPIMC